MPAYHVWFATKRRKWLLQGEVAEATKELMASVAADKGIDLIECETMIDHVHLLLCAESGEELSTAINLLKGVCSRRLFERFPDIRVDAGIERFWQHRFASKAVPEAGMERVRAYIRTQDQRPEKFDR